MSLDQPLIISRTTKLGTLPFYPMPGRDRERRPLFVGQREIHIERQDGWIRIPKGYVTDFASIPWLATAVTGQDLQAIGPWAIGAIGHDWAYAIGEPGQRYKADLFLRWRMELDGVHPLTREVIYRAVRLGGGGGYASAAKWWETANFADPETGAYPIKPPFARQEAFSGRPWGIRPLPDWPAVA